MSAKPRGDAKLKTLPPAVQKELYARCSGPGGNAAAAAWLKAEHGVTAGTGTFSNFWQWYPFSVSASADFARTFEQELSKLPELQGDAEKLSRLGQVGFEMMAMRMQDLEGYATLKKLRLKEHEQSLTERRVALLEQAAKERDTAKKITGDESLSDTEKAQRMRALFGMG